MLYLYQSNRLESLAGMLHRIQTLQTLSEPLAAEQIMVQSQGMRRFLDRFLAEQSGIAANLKYSLPAGFTWQLMRRVLPDIPALSPFSPEVIRWRLMSLFLQNNQADGSFSDGLAEHAPAAAAELAAYLAGGRYAAYDLAGQLADIFDQYLVYRPDWIEAWQRGKLIGLGEDEIWQAELWRYLDDGRQNAPHRVALWQQLLAKLDKSVLPERLFVFGIATLAPMYLDLLKAVSEHCDVHIFALNPSSGYWGNVIEPAQMLGKPDADLSLSGHPLLASLGKQGRDFFDSLAESNARHEISAYEDDNESERPSENERNEFLQSKNGQDSTQGELDFAPETTLLARLQRDIQTLSLPSANSHLDGSIRLVSAHSPLRELHILKEHLLQTLAEHPDWQPHDIAVLTPDVEPYLPFLEAVFGESSGRKLPYSVSDIKISRRQPLLHALELALDIFDSRFETDKILPLLENETVLRRFGLTRDDLPLLHDTVARLNIHWGSDAAMRGGSNNLFTWQQGLERLALGWLLPENSGLWQNISPYAVDPNHTETLARFCAFVRTLADTQKCWQTPADAPEWAARLRRLSEDLTAADEAGQTALRHLEQALARWLEETALAGFTDPMPSETAVRHFSRFLGSQSDAGFLRHGITFCGMVPMRSLPFKMLCLIGLNDGVFPRNTKAAAFDLIAKHPKRGDRSRRDDDRYLFLEALMSAREKLYLSYVGRSQHNNEPLPPSALINELCDVLADMTGLSAEDLRRQWTEDHPLQDFSRRYFDNSGPLASSRSDYADALNLPATPKTPFFQAENSEADEMPSENSPSGHLYISQHEWLSFWRNPVRTWLRKTLDWKAPYREEALGAEEPFEPESTEIAAAYMQARRDNEDFAQTALRLNARSELPAGEIGKIWQAQSEAAAKMLDGELLNSPKHAAFPYTLALDGCTLSGSLEHLYDKGRIRFAAKTPNAPDTFEFYLEHLIFNAVRPSGIPSGESHWLGGGEVLTLPPLPSEKARELLDNWLVFYRIGQTRPLPFFPRTLLAAVGKWLEKRQKPDKTTTPEEAAEKAAYQAYYGNSHRAGQKDDTEIALVFGTDETAPIDSPLFRSIIEQVLQPTWEALHLSQADGNEAQNAA
ncbi:MAG: exodeoxyribonuclease V subunit gamma [Neisseria sp.]|nr:exodeoxyribonuclease V subunit gamma [Neisseria sp.]